MHYKKLLWHNNTPWDENLIGKTTVVNGEEVTDTVAKEAVSQFQEWIKVERIASSVMNQVILSMSRSLVMLCKPELAW